MKTNSPIKSTPIFTHEGSKATRTSSYNNLRRAVMSCLLWEDTFYESGEDIATRIGKLVKENKAEDVAALAIEARTDMKLRHVPLLLTRELARNKEQRHVVADTLFEVIQRADELSEFVSLYWRDGRVPLANSVQKGLRRAFTKFSGFDLSKYNRDGAIKLRDVLFLCHAKPVDCKGRAKTIEGIKKGSYVRGKVKRHSKSIFTQLVDGTLPTPDTWETKLSGGSDKKETFTRLIKEGQLGALALLRNLRGMTEAGVDRDVIVAGLETMKTDRVLPYRFIAAARYAPQFEPQLEKAMFTCMDGADHLGGKTILMIDISGSMDQPLSGKSDLTRIDAACGLAILLREICDDIRIFTFSSETIEVPARRGFALRDAIKGSQGHHATYMKAALESVEYGKKADRLIVISDEQNGDGAIGKPQTTAYMLNVASDQNGVSYKEAWNHVDGFSESVVRWIGELELDQ